MPNTSMTGGDFGGIAPILRNAVLRLGRAGGVTGALEYINKRYITVANDILSSVADIVRQGYHAAKQFVTQGGITQSVVNQMPVIPHGTFANRPADRIVIVGNLQGVSQDGSLLDDRVYTVGMSEGDAIEELLGPHARELWEKINDTNPVAAASFVFRTFVPLWGGKIW